MSNKHEKILSFSGVGEMQVKAMGLSQRLSHACPHPVSGCSETVNESIGYGFFGLYCGNKLF